MKELEKTKRISVAAVITILVVAIAVLSYKRPKHNYAIDSTASLETVLTTDYLADISIINTETDVLIDVRGPYDYDKGHLENAINIYAPELLNDENSEIIENIQKDNKNIILYSSNPDEVLAPFMVLQQLGVPNLKMLPIELSYNKTELITKTVSLEKSNADIKAFIEESVKKAMEKPKPVVKKTPPKKVIPTKKKKKMPVEGGC
jgi:rhodanese-related sulfurtransferase